MLPEGTAAHGLGVGTLFQQGLPFFTWEVNVQPKWQGPVAAWRLLPPAWLFGRPSVAAFGVASAGLLLGRVAGAPELLVVGAVAVVVGVVPWLLYSVVRLCAVVWEV